MIECCLKESPPIQERVEELALFRAAEVQIITGMRASLLEYYISREVIKPMVVTLSHNGGKSRTRFYTQGEIARVYQVNQYRLINSGVTKNQAIEHFVAQDKLRDQSQLE